MYRGTKNVVLLLNHRAKMTTDANLYRDSAFFLAHRGNARLHHDTRAHGLVDRAESRHDLIANGFDNGAAELESRVFHDVQARRHRLAGPGIAIFVIQLRTADNVGKQNCNFEIFSHYTAHNL